MFAHHSLELTLSGSHSVQSSASYHAQLGLEADFGIRFGVVDEDVAEGDTV